MVAPDHLAREGWRRFGAPLLIAGFLMCTAGAGLWDSVDPAVGSLVSKRETRRLRREWRQSRVSDGSRMTLLSQKIDDRSNVRNLLVPPFLTRVLLPLNEGGSGVVVGQDGWLFLDTRIQPRHGGHQPQVIPFVVHLFTAYDRRLASLGFRPLWLPVVRRGAMVGDKLPDGSHPGTELDRAVLDGLDMRGIWHIDMFDELADIPAEELWHHQDTHWNLLAQRTLAEAGARKMGRWVRPAKRASRIIEPGLMVKRVLLMTLGLSREQVEALPPNTEQSVNMKVRWKRKPKERDPLAVVGTSYTPKEGFTSLLSHFADTLAKPLSSGGSVTAQLITQHIESGRLEAGTDLIAEVPLYATGYVGRPGSFDHLHAAMLDFLVKLLPPLHELPVELTTHGRKRLVMLARQVWTEEDSTLGILLGPRPRNVGPLSFQLTHRDRYLKLNWDEDREELFIPLLGQSGAPDPWVLTALGDVRMADLQPRLVTELDMDAATPLPETEVVSQEEGWHQTRAIPQGALAGRHTTLFWSVDDVAAPANVQVTLVNDSGGTHPLSSVRLIAGGLAALRINPADEPWTQVRLSGGGDAPARLGTVQIARVRQTD